MLIWNCVASLRTNQLLLAAEVVGEEGEERNRVKVAVRYLVLIRILKSIFEEQLRATW